MWHRLFIVCAVILLVGCARPLPGSPSPAVATETPIVVPTGSFDGEVTSGGVIRHYLLHVPVSYQPGKALPLVLNFHGYGSNASEEERLTEMSAKADAAGFFVVYPDALDKYWRNGPDTEGEKEVQFVRDLIAALESQYSLDAKRIYATGFSNGGGMTNRLGCDLADEIAAIAPNSGAYGFGEACQPARPMPVLAFHGLDDHIVLYNGDGPSMLLPPIQDWAADWAKQDGCDAIPAESLPVEGVMIQTWSGCSEKAEVILYTLDKHGHSWPGSSVMPPEITTQAVNATDVMWDFFEKHPMP